MEFHYNSRKAAQAAAYLVDLNGGRMDVYALIKVLYFADRKALCERGRPITGDVMVSMPYGPVLSTILDQMEAPEEARGDWRDYLTERANNSVSLVQQNPASDELSEYERNTLRSAHENYGHCSFNELKRIGHALPEFTDPQGSSLRIDPVSILKAEGWSDEEIYEAAMSARQERFFTEICR